MDYYRSWTIKSSHIYIHSYIMESTTFLKSQVISYGILWDHTINFFQGILQHSRPVRRILKRGVQSTAWPLGHGEGEGSFYTMDDLECQIFIQIYREKITETIDLSMGGSREFFNIGVANREVRKELVFIWLTGIIEVIV